MEGSVFESARLKPVWPAPLDVICFSHLRWDFVYQRPQHLMSRFASVGRVFFVEEPLPTEGEEHIEITETADGPLVCVPRLREPNGEAASKKIAAMIDRLSAEH